MSQLYDYQVAKIVPLTATHFQIFLHPCSEKMKFVAGQYVMVTYPNGELMPFSIANAPLQEELELHVRCLANDAATHLFLEHLSSNQTVTMSGPFGDSKHDNHTGKLILIAAGTGFAPSKAIIEQLVQEKSTRECYLYWTVKSSADFYLPHLSVTWQKLLPHFHFIPIETQAERKKRNNVLSQLLLDHVDFSNSQVYVFGPPRLAIDCIKIMALKGLSVMNFFTDVVSKADVIKIIDSVDKSP